MTSKKYTGLEVAIIGMAGKFPGAQNIDEFWENLKRGKSALTPIPEDELVANGVSQEVLNAPNYVKSKFSLEDKEYFDPGFFNYTPAEAELMDPQVRLMHQCVWEAIEDSGNYERMQKVPVGIFSGASSNLEWQASAKYFNNQEMVDDFRASILYNANFMNSQLAYKLQLKGPAVFVDTACSTGLTALHLACRSLLTGDAKIAIAGGVSLDTHKRMGYMHNPQGILSVDGHCKAFNKNSTGTSSGEGAGVVILKKLQNAIKDGDRIYAVVKGSATNNDGSRKIGYTAPSIDGQTECIRVAQKVARVQPDTIGYIEAHGSGTKLGDPIEVAALKNVFDNGKPFNCPLGAVKSTVGHLDVAAGMAGLIKTVLMLSNKEIAPSVHTSEPIEDLNWGEDGFFLNSALKKWEGSTDFPRRAGVNSFGIGGTNVHVVLEEAPVSELEQVDKQEKLITISAKTEVSFKGYVERLVAHVQQTDEEQLADIAYTLKHGRKGFPFNAAASFKSKADLLKKLERVKPIQSRDKSDAVVFMFAGLGSQYVNMCQGLYNHQPGFRKRFQECREVIQSVIGVNIEEVIFAGNNAEIDLLQTGVAQFVVFTIEYSLSMYLMDLGVVPKAVIGYSFGEFPAACIAGVISLEDCIKLLKKRGDLIESMEKGGMLSVPLEKDELEPLLNGSVSIAIDNGESCLVSGTDNDITALEEELKGHRLICLRLNANRAMHSELMVSITADLERFVERIAFKSAEIPMISNVTGTWLQPGEIENKSYWSKHLCQTVLFHQGLSELAKDDRNVYIEIGPGNDIGALINRILDERNIEGKSLSLVKPEMQKVTDMGYFVHQIPTQ
ncbi:MAG: type I polyketide synthase, partial [Flavobacteriales bacterium]|nr:type I polyketide synthase [Flavobacteriales bacterium]